MPDLRNPSRVCSSTTLTRATNPFPHQIPASSRWLSDLTSRSSPPASTSTRTSSHCGPRRTWRAGSSAAPFFRKPPPGQRRRSVRALPGPQPDHSMPAQPHFPSQAVHLPLARALTASTTTPSLRACRVPRCSRTPYPSAEQPRRRSPAHVLGRVRRDGDQDWGHVGGCRVVGESARALL